MSEYIGRILKSITINYKSWIVLLLSSIIIYREHIFLGFIQYIICIFLIYFAHKLSHDPIAFFVNRAHIYHHEHANWLSHVVQVCIELIAGFSPIVLLYYFLDLKQTIFPFDPYIILLFTIFYITTHNVNYGHFHVNNVHRKHHLDYSVNYGPDICDIIFETKSPKDELENTDHYIPNIIFATLFTYYFKQFYESLEDKQYAINIFISLYGILCIIVGYFTIKQTVLELQRGTNVVTITSDEDKEINNISKNV